MFVRLSFVRAIAFISPIYLPEQADAFVKAIVWVEV
jgi:hypothetical protein